MPGDDVSFTNQAAQRLDATAQLAVAAADGADITLTGMVPCGAPGDARSRWWVLTTRSAIGQVSVCFRCHSDAVLESSQALVAVRAATAGSLWLDMVCDNAVVAVQIVDLHVLMSAISR
jgi:hypothetical protein